MRELLIGARLAFTGGRDGLVRTVMTAAGIGIGVAMLLLAVAVPGAFGDRDHRQQARVPGAASDRATANSTLVVDARTTFHDHPVHGVLLRPAGPGAPLPPGLTRFPAGSEAVVSPALRDLLGSPAGALLRERLPYRIAGTIAPAGLAGPSELAYYAGAGAGPRAERAGAWVTAFGTPAFGETYDPVLALLTVVIFVVLLLPVGVFAAAAVRFGGEQRDRRLAAIRLIGADAAMARRIATGEALAAAAAGLLAGGVLFLAGREIIARVSVEDLSLYAADLRPGPAAVLLVAVLVPLLAVGVTRLALRGVVIEPLGVVRRGRPARGRLWWRLLFPAAGLAVLAPLAGSVRPGAYGSAQAATGLVLLLIGVVALLPWLIAVAVSGLRGGPVPWQLAVRWLQSGTGGASARVVNGIAVAVAGAIALQMLFTGIEPGYRTPTGADPRRASATVQASAADGRALERTLGAMPGVDRVVAIREITALSGDGQALVPVRIGGCALLRELATLPSCADGDIFRAGEPAPALVYGDSTRPWPVPAGALTATAATDADGAPFTGLLATPGSVPAAMRDADTLTVYLHVAGSDPDTVERVRNAVERISPGTGLLDVAAYRTTSQFGNLRRGLLAGTVMTLLLIGLSLLVGLLEQLRDRRRPLVVLAAIGIPRATLGWSVLWQSAVPVTLGLVLAVPSGIGVGAVLLQVVGAPVQVRAPVVAGMAGLAAAVVVLVTAASLPILWRIIRPTGLRTE